MKLVEMLSTETEAYEWINSKEAVNPYTYKFDNGVINTTHGVFFNGKFKKLEVQFGKVNGNFNMSTNDITTVEGFPSEIVGDLYIRDCRELKSLKNIHKYVKKVHGDIIIAGLPLESHVLGLLLIDVDGRLEYGGNNVRQLDTVFEILDKYWHKGKSGVLSAQHELIEAGLDDFAEM